ncbi:MAG: hypothetical protein H0X24_13800 [Ktedonobacterales bacterium]|nr:hypothetical protein [Ktedonobacterales bacterium]
MQEWYTLGQAQQALGGIDNKTLHRWIERDGVILHERETDGRIKVLLVADVERMAARREIGVQEVSPEKAAKHSPAMETVLAEMRLLRRKVEALEDTSQQYEKLRKLVEPLLSGAMILVAADDAPRQAGDTPPAKKTRIRTTPRSQVPPLPPEYYPWFTFVKEHDIPIPTARHWMTSFKVIRQESGWLFNGHVVKDVLDHENLERLWEKCRKSEHFVACGHCEWCRAAHLERGWFDRQRKTRNVRDGQLITMPWYAADHASSGNDDAEDSEG